MTDIARRFADLRSAVAAGTYTGPITRIEPNVQLPSREDLDAMCELIGGPNADFDLLPVPDKMRVIELVNQSDSATNLASIATAVDSIDDQLRIVAEWFKNSKVYYP